MAAEGGTSPPLYAMLGYTRWYVMSGTEVVGELSLNHVYFTSFYDPLDDTYGLDTFLLFRDYTWWVNWLRAHGRP